MLHYHRLGAHSHSRHPGMAEKSIGQKETRELAVMVDTFHPLMATRQSLNFDNP